LAEYKLARGCADCGYRAHFAALEFDHPVGTKLFGISNNLNLARARVRAEMEKCGYCFKQAGWRACGRNADGRLTILELLPVAEVAAPA
jgi:hypothetical protein